MNIGESTDVIAMCHWLAGDPDIGSKQAKAAASRLLERAGRALMMSGTASDVERRVLRAIDRAAQQPRSTSGTGRASRRGRDTDEGES